MNAAACEEEGERGKDKRVGRGEGEGRESRERGGGRSVN